MMTRRSLEGAWKCALRDLLREEAMANKKKNQSVYPNSTHDHVDRRPHINQRHHHILQTRIRPRKN